MKLLRLLPVLLALAFDVPRPKPAPIFHPVLHSVTLAWDYDDVLVFPVDGFRVYVHAAGESLYREAGETPWPSKQMTIQGLHEDVAYYFVVTAFAGDSESEPSNEITYEVESPNRPY